MPLKLKTSEIVSEAHSAVTHLSIALSNMLAVTAALSRILDAVEVELDDNPQHELFARED